ncbi:MAG: DCC1-like thiol-disulfide oxidoreductase family protein [Pseudomonadota bacterium]
MARAQPSPDRHTSFEAYSYREDPAVPEFADDKPIIVFDGYCALCTGWAAFVLRHDKQRRYRLLTAQSELGRALYTHFGLDPRDYETNILIEQGVPWFKAEGSIRMAVGLGWPWRAAVLFRVFPQRFSNWLYDKVARNRLRWFGTRETCYVPAPSDADRFL